MHMEAMTLPPGQLAAALLQRIAARKARIAERDARLGPQRIRLTSYMENIGWPELFGYDMNRFFTDPAFAIEQRLRQLIFWTDNVDDDTLPSLALPADVGMYFDLTLFRQQIVHTVQGIPEFLPHALQHNLSLEEVGDFDFHQTGAMPLLIANYRRMTEIVHDKYDGLFTVTFPCFHRGPLDIFVQLRGYEQVLDDMAEWPEQVHAFLAFFANARLRYAQARQAFLQEPALPPTTFVADDWVNIPFISPAMFREFVLPVYRQIRQEEGPVRGFHTCGNFEAVVAELPAVFPEIASLEVSGWNDVCAIHTRVSPRVAFEVHVGNAVSLSASVEEQQDLLEAIAEVSRSRRVSVCAQAIVKLCGTYEETLARLNRFETLAYQIFC
ncbi:MAG: uroporphyrinogen decarboxylase family protein [Armatimonadota bacterium]